MKKIFTFSTLFLCLSTIVSKAQSISPSQTSEVCPGINSYFRVSFTGTSVVSLTGWANGATVVVQPYNINTIGSTTYFDFAGKFADNNVMQSFRLTYVNGGGSQIIYDFEFEKVKSFTTQNSCMSISPNQSVITAPPCQTGTHVVSFNNVQFAYQWGPNPYCFGTVTDYEYLLPVGWSLNGQTSNGTTWIAGDNNETLAYDLSHGIGEYVQVRARNFCASSLQSGPIKYIPIDRQKPPLTFTGGYTVCNASPGTNFQANGVPAAFTSLNWSVTSSLIFGNSNPTSNPTMVTKLYDGEGDIQLTISGGTACPLSFVYNTQEITGKAKLVAGKPFVNSAQFLLLYDGPGSENEACRNQDNIYDFTTGTGSTTLWSYVSHSGSPMPSWGQYGYEDVSLNFFKSTQNTLVLQMDATNTCGTTSNQFGFVAIDCSMRAPKTNSFKVSPNPTYSTVTVSPVNKEKSELISEVYITDYSYNIVYRKSFGKVQSAQFDIADLRPGIYTITIVTATTREAQMIIKQ